jgi:hypothetical protein
MKYGELNLGQVEAIVNKLGGMEGVLRLLSGELMVRLAKHQRKVWKTIKLGTRLKTADDFLEALIKSGFTIRDEARLKKFFEQPAFVESIATLKTEVDLALLSVADLGFQDHATRKDIFKRAQEFGFKLCPAEVGPQLCVQYSNQPSGEYLEIAMNPIEILKDTPCFFNISRDYGTSNFDAFCLDGMWGVDSLWVFVCPSRF